MIFEDRTDAGKRLGRLILEKKPALKNNSLVLAIPRGGVPVGFEIAKILDAPLEVIVTHKLGAPGNEEFAIGAVAEDGSYFISQDYRAQEIARQRANIQQRIKKYRKGRPLPLLKGKKVILVDDGIATGYTMRAALELAKKAHAQEIIIAAPVMPIDTLRILQKRAYIFYLDTPFPFMAIGRFYKNFPQLTDEEVLSYLAAST